MRKQILILTIALCLVLPLISATQTFKQNDVVDLKVQCIINGTYCSASAYCNATISKPDGTLLVNNLEMTNQISYYNITLPSTATLGSYLCSATCCDNGYCGTGTDCDYEITGNGKPTASGGVIVLFSIIFLIIMAFLVFMLVYSIGHVIRLDFDLMDLSYNLGIYFVILTLYFLSQFYLGNPTFESILLVIIQVGAFTHVVVPFIAFIISITFGSMQRRKNNFGQPPKMPIGRRYYG